MIKSQLTKEIRAVEEGTCDDVMVQNRLQSLHVFKGMGPCDVFIFTVRKTNSKQSVFELGENKRESKSNYKKGFKK